METTACDHDAALVRFFSMYRFQLWLAVIGAFCLSALGFMGAFGNESPPVIEATHKHPRRALYTTRSDALFIGIGAGAVGLVAVYLLVTSKDRG